MATGPVQTHKIGDVGLRPGPWLQMARSPDDVILDVLKMILNFVLGPPSPEGSRERIRIAIFQGKS